MLARVGQAGQVGMSRDTALPSDVDVLFVSVNLGPRPAAESFVDNAVALRALARHATFVITPTLDLRELQRLEDQPLLTELRLLRTTLNRTWDGVWDAPSDDSVAGGAAGFGRACLYVLHQLLRTAMSCQTQLEDIIGFAQRREFVAEELHQITVRLARELTGEDYADRIDNYGSWGEAAHFIPVNDPPPHRGH